MTDQPNPTTPDDDQNITLRCNRCGKPITPEEAVLTPTGYRCQDCVRRQQKVFDTAKPLDFVWAFLIAVVISLAGSWLTRLIGFFTFLLAPAVGVAVAEVVRFVIKKRRSLKLFRIVSIGMIIGGIPLILSDLLSFFLQISAGAFSLLRLLPLGYHVLFLVLAVPSAYYRLSGTRRR